MKKLLATLFSVFTLLFACPALADEGACSTGDCVDVDIHNLNEPDSFLDYLEDVDSVRTIYENNITPGFNIGGGVGFGMLAAVDIHLNLGYDIAFNENQNFGFGIYTNAHFRLGIPHSIDWAVTPTFIIPAGNFRFTLGIGIGLYDMFTWELWSSDGDYKDSVIFFDIKPEMRFQWFITNHFYLGLGVELAMVFVSTSNHELNNHSLPILPELNFYFSLGTKF